MSRKLGLVLRGGRPTLPTLLTLEGVRRPRKDRCTNKQVDGAVGDAFELQLLVDHVLPMLDQQLLNGLPKTDSVRAGSGVAEWQRSGSGVA